MSSRTRRAEGTGRDFLTLLLLAPGSHPRNPLKGWWLMLAARIMQHIPERTHQLTSSRTHFTLGAAVSNAPSSREYDDFHHYLCCRARRFLCCDGACHMGSGYLSAGEPLPHAAHSSRGSSTAVSMRPRRSSSPASAAPTALLK